MEPAAGAGAVEGAGPRPSLRLCEVLRPPKGSCGFHLSRTQWDPYPWVSGVDGGSAAEAAGLLAGDCVLEVNGEDVLGERIGAVAARVRARPDRVSLLLWNAGSDPHVANSVCGGAGPTPLSLQRLSAALQAALQLLECPVCLEPAAPRAAQCANGHLLCAGCRARTERCPVCRVALGPRGRCLLADQLHALLAAACQPAARHAPSSASTHAHAHAHATRRHAHSVHHAHAAHAATRHSGAQQQQPPLVQLKSRLLLPPKSSSVEDMSPRPPTTPSSGGGGGGGGGSEGGEGGGSGGGGGEGAETAASAPRARSLSTGQLPDAAPTSPAPAPAPDAAPASTPALPKEPEPLVHCPRGPACAGLLPASRLLQHLQEAHEGPLVQYFVGGAGAGAVRAPAPGAPETVALTTAAGGTLFVCVARAPASTPAAPRGRRLVWLWALGDAGAASRPPAAGFLLTAPAVEGGVVAAPQPAPVFPLSAPWEEVVASDRCLRLDAPDGDDAPLLLRVQLADKVTTTPTPTAPAPTPAPTAVTAVG